VESVFFTRVCVCVFVCRQSRNLLIVKLSSRDYEEQPEQTLILNHDVQNTRSPLSILGDSMGNTAECLVLHLQFFVLDTIPPLLHNYIHIPIIYT